MLTVLPVVIPIFLIIAVGYVCAKTRLISATAISEMGRYVMYVALPAVIVKTILSLELAQIFNLRYLLAYLTASVGLITLGFIVATKVAKQPNLDSAVMMTGFVVPNSAFIGYPIIIQLMDAPPINGFAMALIVENMFVMPLCFILMDYHSSAAQTNLIAKALAVGKRVVRNPLLIAIVVGVVGNIVGLKLPSVVETTLGLLAPSAVSVALFVIGGSLASVVVKQTRWPPLIWTTLGKLVIHPLLALALVSWLLPNQPELGLTLTVITAVPMLSIYTIVGEIYGRQAFCATAQLVTTFASLVTIPIIITIAHWWLGF